MSLADVAKRAGVSTATVSRVLNNISVVKNSTRTRVMKAVNELNYYPNLHARSLAGGKSRTLGLIVSNLANPFFYDIFHALQNDAHRNGFEVVIANTDYDPNQLRRSVQLMLGRRVAGLALIVSEQDPAISQVLLDSGIPAVFYDVGTPQQNISNIRVNYRRGIERLVNYLYRLGHRRMAFVGHHSGLDPTGEREKAFLECVAKHARGTESRTVADQDGLDGGRQATRELLRTGFQATAFICVNDLMAAGVLRELRDSGLRVPEDVSVTGFDNVKLSEFTAPSLTTMHIPRDSIGHLVFEALAPEVSRKPPAREIVIDPELVLRESTAPPPR